MHHRQWGLATGMVIALTAGAQAGVYSTLEPKWPLSDQYFRKFQEESLIPLRQWGTDFAPDNIQKLSQLANTALKLAKDSPGKGKAAPLTADERLNLAAFLLRLRQPEAAIELLKPIQTRERDNFLAASMMGTAYLMQGEYQRAWDFLGDGLQSWQKPFADLTPARKKDLIDVWKWNEQQFAWYGRCEKALKRLALLRLRELKSVPLSFSKALEKVDPLFPEDAKVGDPPLRFVGESGKFEPGKLAGAERAKLPKDAVAVVQQLLIWMPDDQRLYWLLGELLNAEGDIDSAKMILGEFLKKFAQMPEFQFGEAPKKAGDAPAAQLASGPDPEKLFPKFLKRFPEIGQHLQALREFEAPAPAMPIAAPPAAKLPEEVPQAKSKQESEPAVSFQVDWQTLAVGFGAGGLVGFMISWRLRNALLSRRQRKRVAA